MADEGTQAHKGHHKAKSGAKAAKRKEFLTRKAAQEDKAASKGTSKNHKVRGARFSSVSRGKPAHTPALGMPPCAGLRSG